MVKTDKLEIADEQGMMIKPKVNQVSARGSEAQTLSKSYAMSYEHANSRNNTGFTKSVTIIDQKKQSHSALRPAAKINAKR